ncbi:ABC transporter permease [Mesorhizobium sp. NZP2298]|uniref:ABC transporter permease n=1 Tax=Mesorhizobium sp. NZP2298 TaxID=2483403 RepID=UPI0015533F6E|nr:ABC transporter permease [Mesorhizobium sp. NZP2298]QKC96595.1 ABC transporter permease [Mesorhizobium sp. NZP2298]
MTAWTRLLRWESFLLVILIATLVVGTQVSPYFATSSNISIALAGMAPTAIVALPMTLIIITGEIDISVGSMVGLCASIMAICLEQHLPIETAMLVGVAVGALAGLFNGLIIVGFGLPSLVVTIGTLALYRGIAQILLKERGVSDFPDWYQELGFGTVAGTPVPWSILVFLVLFVGFALYLHRSHGGRAIYAIGNNKVAVEYSGINVRQKMLVIFILSGIICSVAAIIFTAYLASARSDTAIGLELPVITAVVLGGVNIFGGSGSLFGVLLALLVLAFVKNILGLIGMTPEQQDIVTGAVLVGTLVVFGGIRNLNDLRVFMRSRHL